MMIAVAAYPIEWHNRWNDYVGKLRIWVRTAAESGAQLLVFPEFAAIELASLAEEDNASDPARAAAALTSRIKDVDALHASLAREFDVHVCAASGPIRISDGRALNRARLFAPDGNRGAQDKLTPDANERDRWGVEPGARPRLFETTLGRIGVLIGRDVEAPGLAAALVAAGADVLLVPSYAATQQAAADRRDAAQAVATRTGCAVALAAALAAPDQAPALGECTGAAAILAPGAERPLAEGKPDAPGWTYAEPPAPTEGAAADPTSATEWDVALAKLEPPAA